MSLLKLKNNLKVLKSRPRYVFMRTFARFNFVKSFVKIFFSIIFYKKLKSYRKGLNDRMGESVFSSMEQKSFLENLKKNGVSFGLKLPESIIKEILEYAQQTPSYADREVDKGFRLEEKDMAEKILNKPILVSQYFNSSKGCSSIKKLTEDPFLLLVATDYLQNIPTLLGVNLWWTFPVKASLEDRSRHAHFFHRDVDDFIFLKYFFYLTDIKDGDGAHICIPGSQINPPAANLIDHLLLRRWSDEEVVKFYGEENVMTINGPAGLGFAEDTFCTHKGSTPLATSRLILSIQYGLFDYGNQNDHASPEVLKMLS